MAALNILIVGAGVAGPALASLLLRSRKGHSITVIERAHDLRTNGAQIDVKAQAIPVLRGMGLLEKVKQHTVNETGLDMADSNDRVFASMGVSAADKKDFTLTTEYEIMRGDLVKIIYDDSLAQAASLTSGHSPAGSLTYRLGLTISTLKQDEKSVEVVLSNGEHHSYDLVVAADGQRSPTRSMAFGADVSAAAYKSLGIYAAYFSIPQSEGESSNARACLTPHRLMLTRPHHPPRTGAYVFTTMQRERLLASSRKSMAEQKEVWSDIIKGCVWQEDRFQQGLKESTDFFAHEQGQVKMSELYKDRVVLLGDAGYCPSPFTGLGTTLALNGAQILAGELAQESDDVSSALEAYQSKIRPLVDECQELVMGGPQIFFRSSPLGVWMIQLALRMIPVLMSIWHGLSYLKIDKLASAVSSSAGASKDGWKAPEYAELNLNTMHD